MKIHDSKFDPLSTRFYCIAKYCFLFASLLFVLSPLLPNHYFPWLSFHGDFLAAIALWLLALGVTFKFKAVVIPAVALVLLGVAVIPMLQLFFGQINFLGDGVMASTYLFGFAVSVILGRQLSVGENSPPVVAQTTAGQPTVATSASFLLVFASCVLVTAVVSAVFALYQWLGLSFLGAWVVDIAPGGRPYANIAQPNNLSTLLCIGLISVIYIRERGLFTTGTAVLLAGLLVFAIALTQSRTGWLIVSLFVIWWFWQHKKLELKLGWIGVISLVAGYFLFIKTLPIITELLYLPIANEKLAELGVRSVIWRQLLDAVWQGPFWGYGWNQLSYAQLLMAADPAYPSSVFVEHSHNLLIDLLVWNGAVLGGILGLTIVWWGVKNAVSCKSLGSWYGLACISALAVHSMLEFPIEYAYFLFPIGLVVGSVNTPNNHALSNNTNKVLYCPKWVAIVVLIISAGFIGTVFYEYQKIESDGRLLRFESARIGSLKAETKAPDVKVLTQLREFLRFARTEAHADMSEAEIAWMEQVAHRYAYPPALFRYALALLLNDRPAEGQLELLKLRQLHGEEHYAEAKASLILMAEKYPELGQLRSE